MMMTTTQIHPWFIVFAQCNIMDTKKKKTFITQPEGGKDSAIRKKGSTLKPQKRSNIDEIAEIAVIGT